MEPGTTDQDLLDALMARDSRAQAAIFKRYYRRLQRLCCAQLGVSEHDAEEVAEDALATLFLDPSRYDRGRGVPLSAWLFRVARNRAIDRLRRGRRAQETALDPRLPAAGEVEPGPLRRAAREVARLARGQLGPEQAWILELYARGWSHAEIACATNRSASAVRQAVSRARRRIRDAVRNGALSDEARATLGRFLARGGEPRSRRAAS